MSLCCAECGHVMGPTPRLPGDDGVMVSPLLLSVVWKTEATGERHWQLLPNLVEVKRSLCFRCVAAKISADRAPFLSQVYQAIKAETTCQERDEQQKGRMIGPHEMETNRKLYERFRQQRALIDDQTCLLCGSNLAQKALVSFMAISFNRGYCRKFPAGFLGEKNYSITNFLPPGETAFRFCWQCLIQCFPSLCQAIEYDLTGNPSDSVLPSHAPEIMFTEAVADALREGMGVAAAQEVMNELGVKIIGPGQN